MNCKECKEARQLVTMPFAVHESAMARMERVIKKQWITIIILIATLIGSNLAWCYYESQFETVETEVIQENDDGYNNYVGNDGEITNGKTNN